MYDDKSLARLNPVHADLRKLMLRAREIFEQSPHSAVINYKILKGLRDASEQRQMVAEGKSLTMDSRHLTGHAIDLGVFKNGAYIQTIGADDYCAVVEYIRQAAIELNIRCVWGAVWDKPLHELKSPLMAEIEDYVERQKARNELAGNPAKKVLLDGPHIELSRRNYP